MAAVLLALSITLSCASPGPTVKHPPGAGDNATVAAPEIMNIVGMPEWSPSKEGMLLCAAREPDGNPLTYYWSAEKGTITGDGEKVTWTPPDSAGDYEITVRVVSSTGKEATFSKKLKVINPAPEPPDRTVYLNLTIPSQGVVKANGQLRAFFTGEIQCNVQGRDPSELTYTWTCNAGKLAADGINEGKASRVGWISTGQGGNYNVWVTVEDKSGNRAQGEVDFEVRCCREPDPK